VPPAPPPGVPKAQARTMPGSDRHPMPDKSRLRPTAGARANRPRSAAPAQAQAMAFRAAAAARCRCAPAPAATAPAGGASRLRSYPSFVADGTVLVFAPAGLRAHFERVAFALADQRPRDEAGRGGHVGADVGFQIADARVCEAPARFKVLDLDRC